MIIQLGHEMIIQLGHEMIIQLGHEKILIQSNQIIYIALIPHGSEKLNTPIRS